MRNVMLNCGLIGESILPRQIKAQALSIFCSFDRYCNLCVGIYTMYVYIYYNNLVYRELNTIQHMFD